MKKITILFLLFIAMASFTQTEDSYKTTVVKISESYNAKDAKAIFDLFSAELQSTFTLEKVESFIQDNQMDKGMIGESSFLVEEETTRHYLLEFDNTSTILVIGLSSDNKINKLSLEEY
ncbi:hypothetical protein GCM10022393_14880 [Aquimarina addita]|uniref:DUF3887 domain-containing protein n=1 Tax=Aquimarina addita TaxID=870485 RepID=A0ABP7XH72_9FLAO